MSFTADPPNDPHAPLVAAARNGDVEAFAELVRDLETRVFRFILRRVPEEADARDLTQDTFLEAFRKLDTFRGASKFSTWVQGIALNLTRNFRTRRPENRYPTVSEDALADLPEPRAGPYEHARSNALARALREGMAGLSDDLREALTVVAFEGHAYEDAAIILDVPVGTVKTRVFRARAALREFLQREDKTHLLED